MSVTAAAIIGSAVVGAISSERATKAGVKSAKEGLSSQERIARENLDFQREIEASQREDFAPWQESGEAALEKINLGIESGEFDPGKFTTENIDMGKDPGYQFRMSEGVKAMERSAASRGGLLGGAQQKALSKYSQDVASQEYQNVYARHLNEYNLEADRKRQKFNILSGLSSQGQASASRMAGATSQLGLSAGASSANLSRATGMAYNQIGKYQSGLAKDQASIANQAAQNWLTYKNQNQKPPPTTNKLSWGEVT